MTVEETEIGNFPETDRNREIESRFLRLKQAVKNAGGLAHVAVAANVGTTTLSGYMNGREWKVGIAEQIAQACHVDLRWLLFGDQCSSPQVTKLAEEQRSPIELTQIPGYDIELSAGHGFPAGNSIEQVSFRVSSELLPDEIRRLAGKLVGMRVYGDSMEPTFFSGDVVAVNIFDTNISGGGIYAVRIYDQLLIKRLNRRINGNILVISDNKKYPPDEIDAKQMQSMIRDGGSPMQIIGRVVWRSGILNAF